MAPKKPKKRRPYAWEENQKKKIREMSNRHLDVLQNIEYVLVEEHRRNDAVDDCVAASALKAAIKGCTPADPLPKKIFDKLCAVRVWRDDVSDEIWAKGLSVVLESVQRHSEMEPGDTDYLDFVTVYVP